MMILDGKATSKAIQEEIKKIVATRMTSGQKRPHLAAVIVGDNPASRSYVGHKIKACEFVGFDSSLIELPENIRQDELIDEVQALNDNQEIDGFIVQLPLPDHIDAQSVLEAVAPEKDVDGFHPINAGKLSLGIPSYLPATPAGIIELLDRYAIETAGKHAVILGRSSIVGTPMALLLSRNASPGNCTVTICHSRTQNLAEITRTADILIAAIGKPHFVTSDMIKPGAVVIDVGINRIEDGTKKSGFRLTGDVDFDAVAESASAITPVPGGVGPMTIAMLLKNTLQART
ncbi:MAG: bifunctional methylenetetrahydrofolate dehydrogenase/methenyltetrahydrofolate cyclohydrolase FolD [Flavobacteriales bacterium]|jgi:methylenetetrahydrofolate dehydrogenase (NADP+)/methenyltetrahydrofolate cyclohydrolase|nr:bifunctional methylenetetrahydrofolate dehydrogenase/methenyltetrahydrofolate cyclohydrolase FolD [Flavobacteriales bacterium]